MSEQSPFASYYQQAELYLAKGGKLDSLEKFLLDSGSEDAIAQEVVNKLKQLQLLKRRRNAGYIVFIGAFLCGIGFLASVLLYHTDSSLDWALYGCTSLGITILFYGLYELLG